MYAPPHHTIKLKRTARNKTKEKTKGKKKEAENTGATRDLTDGWAHIIIVFLHRTLGSVPTQSCESGNVNMESLACHDQRVFRCCLIHLRWMFQHGVRCVILSLIVAWWPHEFKKRKTRDVGLYINTTN